MIEYILQLIIDTHKNSENLGDPCVEYLRSEEYDTQKDALLDRLSKGEKLFVISTYQTIGTGQNLQYKIPPELQGKLIRSNNLPPRDEKDFDAIYLDKPTNLLVNMEQDWPGESFIKYLFQVEFLQENSELSMAETIKHVRKAFECYTTGNRPNNIVENVYDKKSVRTYATKAVVQAIGRICRTNQKNPNIYIFADDRIADYLDLSITQDRILNREFMALIRKIEGTQKKAPVCDDLENRANLVSTRAGKDIDKLLNGTWTKERMKKWQDLRQLVLKFPTVSKQEAERNFIFSNYYVKLQEKSNILYYTQENDYRNVNVSFAHDKKPAGFLVEDKSGTRLDRLMQWGALRDYFQAQGYATDFTPNDYIMSPSIWNNIYKGALGEIAGKFWFAQVLGIYLEDISEPEKFELFDFKIPGKAVYVDFKDWNEATKINRDEMVDKIKIKADKCGCKCAIIANIIAGTKYKVQKFYEGNIEFLIIPSLLRDGDGISIDNDAMLAIRSCLNEFTDKN